MRGKVFLGFLLLLALLLPVFGPTAQPSTGRWVTKAPMPTNGAFVP